MEKLGVIVSTMLLLGLAIVPCNSLWPELRSSLVQLPHSRETLRFLLSLIHGNFRSFHVNLVNIDGEYMDHIFSGQVLQEANPVSIMEPHKISPLQTYGFFHQQSSCSELNIILARSPDPITSLPQGLTSPSGYNIIIHVNISPGSVGQPSSVLTQTQYASLKYKIELVSTQNEVVIQSVCFYCGENGQSRVLRLGCLTCGRTLAPVIYSKRSLFQDYTKDFNGRPLRVYAGTTLPTLNRFTQAADGTWVPVAGFQVPLLLALQKKLNFAMNITLLKSFGRREANGSYSGLIGKVNSGEAELGVGAVTTFERYLAVDYMTPNSIQCSVFSTAMPTNKVKWQAVFQSMSIESWLILAAICMGFILPLYMGVYMLHRNCDTPGAVSGVLNCLDFLYRSVLEQASGPERLFPQISGRILLGSWLYFSILLGNAYKSRLVSVMVSPVNEIIPNSFEELAASDYTIYTHFAGGALSKVIQTTPSATFRKISKRMILEKSMVKCIEFSLRPKTACISYYDNLNGEGNKNFTDRNGNTLYRKSPGTAFMFPVSVILPLKAPYRDAVNKVILHLIDTGVTQRMLDTEIKALWTQGKRWATATESARIAVSASDDSGDALKFQHFQGVYAVLFVGLALSVTLFILEKLRMYFSFKGNYELGGNVHKMLIFGELR